MSLPLSLRGSGLSAGGPPSHALVNAIHNPACNIADVPGDVLSLEYDGRIIEVRAFVPSRSGVTASMVVGQCQHDVRPSRHRVGQVFARTQPYCTDTALQNKNKYRYR